MANVVVTSFSVAGARLYGRRMGESLRRFWPLSHARVIYADGPIGIRGCEERLTTDLPDWMACKRRWASDPAVQGRPATLPKGKTYHYRYDAARFAVKHFVMRDAAVQLGHGIVTWLDGDTVTTRRIPEDWGAVRCTRRRGMSASGSRRPCRSSPGAARPTPAITFARCQVGPIVTCCGRVSQRCPCVPLI